MAMLEYEYRKLSPYYSVDFKERSATKDSEPAWTTSRCHRLLRPLSSKIALLRKMKTMGSKELCNPLPDTYIEQKKELSSWARPTCPSWKTGTSSSDYDLDNSSDWTTDSRPPKRLRRTYSSKSSVQPTCHIVAEATQTRETSAEDILRVFNEKRFVGYTQLRDNYGGLALHGLSDDEPEKFPSAKTESVEWEVGCGQKTPLRGAFTKLAKNLSPVNWRTLDGLHGGVLALLNATLDSSQAEQRQKGWVGYAQKKTTMEHRSKSLFATCLRKIPDCIIEEQRSTTTEDPENDVDVSATTYNYLEQMSPSNPSGWKPLKDVVRAHGIAMLVAAIKECLIILPIARALVVLCLEQGACDEAAVIVEAMITIMKPLPKPGSANSLLFSYRTSVTLQTMHTMLLITKCARFEYAQLAKLFENGVIPFEWVCTPDMVDCWTRAIISTTQGRDDATEAATLIQTVIAKAYTKTGNLSSENIHDLRLESRHKRRIVWKCDNSTSNMLPIDALGQDDGKDEEEGLAESIANVLSNLLTVLSAISTLRCARTPVLTQMGLEARRMSELRTCRIAVSKSYEISQDQLALPLLASAISTPDIDHQCLEQLTHGLMTTTPKFSVTAGWFLCNVAACYGRVAAKDPFEQLQDLIKRLGHKVASYTRDESCRATYNTIFINAAFNFAEQSGQPRHFEGALALEQRLRGGKAEHASWTPGKTPTNCRQRSRSGFRWEEGICEWVAQSPDVALTLLEKCSNETGEAQNPSDEKPLNPSTNRHRHPAESSPCTKRNNIKEAQDYSAEGINRLVADPGNHQSLNARGRGRPKKKTNQIGELHKGLENGSVQEGLQKAPKYRKIRPVVIVERAKFRVLFRGEGAAKATSRSKGSGFMNDSESEDELSLL